MAIATSTAAMTRSSQIQGGSNSSRSKLRKKKQALIGILRIELALN